MQFIHKQNRNSFLHFVFWVCFNVISRNKIEHFINESICNLFNLLKRQSTIQLLFFRQLSVINWSTYIRRRKDDAEREEECVCVLLKLRMHYKYLRPFNNNFTFIYLFVLLFLIPDVRTRAKSGKKKESIKKKIESNAIELTTTNIRSCISI